MSTTDDIAGILKSRKLDALKGLRENQWFDAKRAAGYNLAIAAGRFELAKDVSALANAEGWHILVGLTTIDLPDEQTEEVDGLDLLPSGVFNAVALQGVLKEYLHPRVLYLNPYGLETMAHMTDMTRYRAPDENGEIQITVPTTVLRENAPRASYLLVERIYLWFGVPTNQIPYVSGADSDRVVDVDTLRRGGRAAQPG